MISTSEPGALLAERLGIEVALMANVGHFVMIEDAETFNRLLEAAVCKMIAGAHSGR